jgi:dTMP kinase
VTEQQGVLIALEGIDGAGKTTQAARLAAALQSSGRPVLRSKEPTDGRWGKLLRESASNGRLDAPTELDLFMKDRREHVEHILSPALSQGHLVIVDRYYFSTVAYQGARGMDPLELLRINEAFAPAPDLLIHLDVNPRVGLGRIALRGDIANAFENEATLGLVADVFRSLDLPYLIRIDGTFPPEDITAGILEVLYSGPLAAHRQPIRAKNGRAEVPGDLWTRLAAS